MQRLFRQMPGVVWCLVRARVHPALRPSELTMSKRLLQLESVASDPERERRGRLYKVLSIQIVWVVLLLCSALIYNALLGVIVANAAQAFRRYPERHGGVRSQRY